MVAHAVLNHDGALAEASTTQVPLANSERVWTQEPPLALMARSAFPGCKATNSNNAKDGTYLAEERQTMR